MVLHIPRFACVFLVSLVCCVYADLPNYYCKYADQKLECFEDMKIEIPINFDSNKIPDDVKLISLSCPGSESNTFHNVVKKTAPAFPARTQLSSAYFKGFKAEDGGRFPANVLLANVKGQIVILDIRNSFIGKLDADYFSGYSGLKTLTLENNDLTEIVPNTFQALTAKPPVLDTVSMTGCKLASLDWAVWQPVADSVTDINLSNQKTGLATLSRSGASFFMKNLKKLALVNNKLSSVPREVLETINYNVFTFQLQGNPFCPTNVNCAQCAELTDFFRWICDLKKPATTNVNSVIRYTCGSGAAAKDSSLAIDRYSHNFTLSAPNSVVTVDVAQFNPNCTVHVSKSGAGAPRAPLIVLLASAMMLKMIRF